MFKDPHFKLALLDSCSSLKKAYGFGWDADYDEFCRKNFGEAIEDNEYEPSEKIEKFFLGLDIPKEDLEAINGLTLDGDNSVYPYIVADFANMSDLYKITSLEGIENLANLKNLNLAAMVEGVSLEPLAKMDSLEKIDLDFNDVKDFKALLKIPNLKKIKIWNFACYKEERSELEELIEDLKKKGVAIEF